MPTISIPAFLGECPKITPRLLENNQASIAVNCNLERGHLEAMAGPGLVTDLPCPARSIWRHEQDGWLGFANAASIVKSRMHDVAGESATGQLFITGDRDWPSQYLAGGKICRLGLPRPALAPDIEVVHAAQEQTARAWAWCSGHREIAQARYGEEEAWNMVNMSAGETCVCRAEAWPDNDNVQACAIKALAWIREWQPEMICDCKKDRTTAYCYTFARKLAGGRIMQESAPSPVSNAVDVPDGCGVYASGFAGCDLPEAEAGFIRLYRTVAGAQTSEFHFVCELALPCSGYLDTWTDRDIGSEILQTATWDAIPDDAQGLVGMENGIYAAFRGNEVLLSEPFHPYAFPCDYRLTVEDRIVALAEWNNELVILTEGRPYVAFGDEPGQMQLKRLNLGQGCVSARSVAVLENGVFYASPDGLVSIGANGSGVATQQLFTREQWQKLGPERMLGAGIDGRYLCFFYGSNRGFVLGNDGLGLIRIELEEGMKVLGLYPHAADDCVYLAVEEDGRGSVWKWQAGARLPYRWRSRPFFISRLCSMRNVRIEFDERSAKRANVNIYGPDLKRPKQRLKLENTRTKRIQSMRAEKVWTLEFCGRATIFEARLGTGVEELEYGG